jgi:crotonobetainyl-CoA:carnitine CoA-transferase CaiB-like acyl-CoA transferase
VLERLQIDYPTLCRINPRIIQCSITGFGAEGEYKDYPALDINIQAISGHTWLHGHDVADQWRVAAPTGLGA